MTSINTLIPDIQKLITRKDGWKEQYRKIKENPERWARKRETSRRGSAKWIENNPEKRLLCNARSHAKERNVPFNLDLEDIIIPEFCPILGKELKTRTPHAPSVDRKIPSLGYVKGNVWVISRRANLMKQDASYEELRKFGQWASRL